jgi:colicin import membrane protein
MSRIVLANCALLLCVGVAAGQKEKKPTLPSGDMFFTQKGQPFALERTFPGIQAALMLTDEQKLKLQTAREETVGSEAIREAGRNIKGNANATEAEKEAAKKLAAEARAKLEQQIASILTADQKALVEKLNTAAQDAHKTAADSLQAEFTASKGNKEQMAEVQKKMKEEARAEFERKLVGLLNAEQRAAVEKAAAAQKAAEAAGKGKVRP